VDDLGREHAQDAKHSKASILNLNVERPELLGRLIVQVDSEVSRAEISRGPSLPLLDDDLVHANDNRHLAPSFDGDDVEGLEAIGDVLEFESGGGGEESLELVVLLNEHAEGGRHGDPAVLQLNTTVVGEVLLDAAVRAGLEEAEGTVCLIVIDEAKAKQRCEHTFAGWAVG